MINHIECTRSCVMKDNLRKLQAWICYSQHVTILVYNTPTRGQVDSSVHKFRKDEMNDCIFASVVSKGCYARLHRVPYPLRTAKCLRSSYHSAPRRVARKLTPPFLRRKIPRGAHSIIRYSCRDDHATHNRRKKKVSIGQETHPTLASLRISASHPLVCNRSFASATARSLAGYKF